MVPVFDTIAHPVVHHDFPFVEKVVSVLHEVDLLEEQVGLLLLETLFFEDLLRGKLQLVVSSLDGIDINLLFLVHIAKPIEHDVPLFVVHGTETVKEVTRPHNLREHHYLVDEMACIGDQLPALHLEPVRTAGSIASLNMASV